MTRKRFLAVLLDGHKGTAVEVPFDPARTWGLASVRLMPGRRGHFVRGTFNGIPFESSVVPRSGRFWLLVAKRLKEASGILLGEAARIVLEPQGPALTARAPRVGKRPRPATKTPPGFVARTRRRPDTKVHTDTATEAQARRDTKVPTDTATRTRARRDKETLPGSTARARAARSAAPPKAR